MSLIDTYIMPMVAELVRDQIALIISTELPGLKALAESLIITEPGSPQGEQAQKDLDNGIYDIIDNIFIEKGTHFQDTEMPGLNIYFGRSDFSGSQGDTVHKQKANTSYIIEVHEREKHEQAADVIKYGDEKSARNTARILGILRGILMSGQYVTLGGTFKKIVWRRRVTSLDVFQPDYQESDGRHGIVGMLNILVEFEEIGPEISGEILLSAITDIKVKLKTADDGKIIQIAV